jgi:hypothetical protein
MIRVAQDGANQISTGRTAISVQFLFTAREEEKKKEQGEGKVQMRNLH